MADVKPFRALRYDSSKVKLENVLTQPYDKITPEMQASYYAADAHNLVRIELGKTEAGDGEKSNVYTRAAKCLADWKAEGVLVADDAPSIYAYVQGFESPTAPGQRLQRRGFIALGRLRDYSEKETFRHEQTLAKPKADRLNLLRATRTHSGQIFMLYSDPMAEVDAVLQQETAKSAPAAEITDEFGVVHRLWKISDPATIALVQQKMADKKLIIADGHHRYETALAYRNERRANEIGRLMTLGRTAGLVLDTEAPYENLMMTFVNMEAEGLVILPTHRVVFGLKDFDATKMIETAKQFFFVHKLPQTTSTTEMMKELAAAGNATAFVAVTKDSTYFMRANASPIADFLKSFSEEQRSLDVVQLHKILLEHVLGISEETIRDQSHLNYVRSADEAVQRVRKDANVAFLMNPVRLDQMWEVAIGGGVMPQKSTDFYPKLLSGLTLYALD